MRAKDIPVSHNQLYLRPLKMSARDKIVEKIMAKQALIRGSNYLKQVECPFLPLGIVPHLFHDWNDLHIYTYCEECLVKVKESPEHAIIKLAEKGQTPISLK